jgi:multidrug efflux pump subunit AcrB
LLGSAGLVGVAINASIVMLAAVRANPAARVGDVDAMVYETLGATRHIVSTTLTAVGGFLPLLLFSGGVGLSIILGLVFTPALYRIVAAGQAEAGALPDGSPA